MKANVGRRRNALWVRQKDKLRQDGLLLKFKLGTRLQEGPVPNASNENLISQSSKPCGERRLWPKDPDEKGTTTYAYLTQNPQLIYTNPWGLRGDPFNTFPIPNQGHVPSAFDYCQRAPDLIHNIANLDLVTHNWYLFSDELPQFKGREARSQLARRLFSTILADKMCFEQCIAWSLFILSINGNHDNATHLTKNTVYHANNVLVQLQDRISSNRGTEDAVLFTIISLAAFSFIADDFRSFATHAKALQHIVFLRGGYDNLGWDGYMKAAALSIVYLPVAQENLLQQATQC